MEAVLVLYFTEKHLMKRRDELKKTSYLLISLSLHENIHSNFIDAVTRGR